MIYIVTDIKLTVEDIGRSDCEAFDTLEEAQTYAKEESDRWAEPKTMKVYKCVEVAHYGPLQ